jgi:hypothetical protein
MSPPCCWFDPTPTACETGWLPAPHPKGEPVPSPECSRRRRFWPAAGPYRAPTARRCSSAKLLSGQACRSVSGIQRQLRARRRAAVKCQAAWQCRRRSRARFEHRSSPCDRSERGCFTPTAGRPALGCVPRGGLPDSLLRVALVLSAGTRRCEFYTSRRPASMGAKRRGRGYSTASVTSPSRSARLPNLRVACTRMHDQRVDLRRFQCGAPVCQASCGAAVTCEQSHASAAMRYAMSAGSARLSSSPWMADFAAAQF